MPLPTLQTERLLLRDLALDDADDMFEYTSNPVVSKYMLWQTHRSTDETRAAITKYKTTKSMMQWAIVLKSENKVIGVGGFGIVDLGMRKADVGYSFNNNYWGRGFATEAMKAVLKYGFEELNLVRIQGATHPKNPTSSRVLEKCGMQHEGILKSWMLVDGRPVDTHIFGIVTNTEKVSRITADSR